MRTAVVELESVSPYSQSRFHETAKIERELADAYEARTWKQRLHRDAKGMVFIPPMSLKNCLAEAAKYMGIQIPGKGKSNYTKHFEAGILIFEPIELGIHADDVNGEWLFLDSNGKKGSGTRVKRCYPRIDHWSGTALIHVLDEIITEDVLLKHLEAAGSFIGMGRFRPRNGCFYGRFKVNSLSWK